MGFFHDVKLGLRLAHNHIKARDFNAMVDRHPEFDQDTLIFYCKNPYALAEYEANSRQLTRDLRQYEQNELLGQILAELRKRA